MSSLGICHVVLIYRTSNPCVTPLHITTKPIECPVFNVLAFVYIKYHMSEPHIGITCDILCRPHKHYIVSPPITPLNIITKAVKCLIFNALTYIYIKYHRSELHKVFIKDMLCSSYLHDIIYSPVTPLHITTKTLECLVFNALAYVYIKYHRSELHIGFGCGISCRL